MAEFCECGSLLINGQCSNKNCSFKAAAKPAASVKSSSRLKAAGKSADAAKPSQKAANPRRASKVITYNLYDTQNDMQQKEPEN